MDNVESLKMDNGNYPNTKALHVVDGVSLTYKVVLRSVQPYD